jgi:hypothetical protein
MLDLNEMEKDSRDLALPSDEETHRIGELAKRQVTLELAIAEEEDRLAEMKKELDQIRDKDLSDLLLAHGLTELKLATGQKIAVEKMVFASITKERATECFRWLEAHGFGSLIKRSLEVNVGKGGEEKVEKLVQMAKTLGLDAKAKDSVHPSTLKAFAKEQLEKASEFPMDLFGVFMINRTKIQ